MLIDPHVNPRECSPAELIDRLIEASIDGAVIACTHSAKDSVPYVKALLDDEFVCFVGVELKTTYGDLVFIPQDANDQFFNQNWAPDTADQGEEVWDLDHLLEQLDEHEGVLCLTHPYNRLQQSSWGDRAYTLKGISATATRIGRGLAHRDFLSDQLSQIKGWSRLGTSGGDCQFLGSAMTVVAEDVETQEALCQALSMGVCWPIEFEDPMFPRARYQGVVEDEGPRRQSLDARERREALNEVARSRGYQVEERVDHRKPGGRWGQRGSSQDQRSRDRGDHRDGNRGQGRGQSRGQGRGQNRSSNRQSSR